MKKLNKKNIVKFIVPIILSISMSFSTAGVTYYNDNGNLKFEITNTPSQEVEEEESDDWEDWTDIDLSIGADDSELSDEVTLELVSENKSFKLWYDTTGADIYVLDKRNGHIWSNTVNEAYYKNEEAPMSVRSMLLQVTVADNEDDVVVTQLCDAVFDENSFTLNADYSKDGMTLSVEVVKFSVSFDVVFSLDEQGLAVSIPSDSIVQENGSRIISIAIMPYFGAARTDQSGYLLIPDGSGALVEFNNTEAKEERVYTYSLYGQSEQNMRTLLSRDDQDIKNMMLPVFGVKNDKNGFLAAVTAGAESTYLNVVPYGYQCKKLARAYYTLMYSYTEQITINGKNIEQIMPTQEISDRQIKYFLLDNGCGYSDMAAAYREYLEKNDVLRDKVEKKNISLDIVMGVKKKGMFFESIVSMTDYKAAQKIAADLKKNGIEGLEISLLGWNKGGITTLPTSHKAAGQLGGKRDIKELCRYLSENDIKVYLYSDFLSADVNSKTVNIRNDIIRDYVGNIVKWSDTVMVNAFGSLNGYISSAHKSGLYKNAGFSLARAGQWLWNSYESGKANTRTQTVSAIEKAFGSCKKNYEALQVYGGNQYVLPFADSIREIPDEASNYYYETASVPFYQLVVSGYVNYTSVAGNMSYDTGYQKLKWIEYGSVPYYIITEENSVKLIDTDFDRLFSSEYSVWGEQIKATYEEYQTRLGSVKDAYMTAHRRISDTVSCVSYSNGACVYVNYGKDEAHADGFTLEPMDYTVVTSEGKVAE